MGTSLPVNGQDTRRSCLQQPVSSAIDTKVSQVVERYHNPDPLSRLISLANEATIIVEGQRFPTLIDSGT